mgnify:CR=1 FL=1
MSEALHTRLAFLLETVALEARHLEATDTRRAAAVTAAHEAVPMLVRFAEACRGYAEARGLAKV